MKKEIPMEARLLLAFVLMGIVLWVTPYFIKTPPPTGTKTAVVEPPKDADKLPTPVVSSQDSDKDKAKDKAATNKAAAGKATKVTVDAQEEAPAEIQAANEETVVIETDLAKVTFSNRGAVVTSWILKNFKDNSGKLLELVPQVPRDKIPPPFSVMLKGENQIAELNTALYRVERSAGGLGVSFEFASGRAVAKKSFTFLKDSYKSDVISEVTINGVMTPHTLAWRGGFGDSTIVKPEAAQKAVYYDVANSKLNQKDVSEAKNGPVTTSGSYSFAGLEDTFFANVFLTTTPRPVEITILSDPIPVPGKADEPRVGAAVGGEGRNVFSHFVGPKDLNLLGKIDPKLEHLIAWGWFEIIAKPLFTALNWTAERLNHNYGWAIVLVTIVINLVLFPLRLSSLKSSKKMQFLKPQIDAINAKYKGLSMRDPKKQEQNQEIMDLYKKNGVNPVGGCLPMLLQLPFLFAFYTVLTVGIQMRGASWLWIPDLSQPEAYHILTILLMVSQFISQKMTPSPGMDPAQQKMMLIMPLFFGFMFWYQSAGLVLYWMTGNLVAIIQQLLLNKSMPAPAAAVIDVKPVAKKRK